MLLLATNIDLPNTLCS